jgi:hypothetical protein
MLKLVSRFVVEVLPYVLSALIVMIVLPGFLSAQFHGSQPAGAINRADKTVSTLELVRDDHAAFAPEQGVSNLSSSAAQDQLNAK